jgi:hypothetical protein
MVWTATDEGLLHGLRLRDHLAAGGELVPQPAQHPLLPGEVQYFSTGFRHRRLPESEEGAEYRRLKPKWGDPIGVALAAPLLVAVNVGSRQRALDPYRPTSGTLIVTNRRLLQLLWGGKCENLIKAWGGNYRDLARARITILLGPPGIYYATQDRHYNLEVDMVAAPWLYVALVYLIYGNRWASLDVPADFSERARANGKQLPVPGA